MITAQHQMRDSRESAKLGTVLCVDDDPVVQLMLGDVVGTAGGEYVSANCARDAETLLAETRFDLILLDRKLPDSDGLLLLQEIKQNNDCPVIILSTMDETRDKILGLGLGAAEYVTKPFSPVELSSRIRAVLVERNTSRQQMKSAPITCGDLSLHPDTRCLRVGKSEAFLPPAESRLLHIFLQHPSEPQTRDALTRFACGRDWTPGDRTIDVLVNRLRGRLPKDAARIVTVHRFGYMFDPGS